MAIDQYEELSSILITQEQLKDRVKELGEEITKDYQGKDLALVGILKGSVVFMSDLMRNIELPCTLDFMAVSSYGNGTTTSGAVRILKDLDMPIENRNVLIIEDILDSGLTLSYIINLMVSSKPASIRLVTLLDKPYHRRVPVKADYRGFTIPDEFVVGYGLDFAEEWRNLPFIGILDTECPAVKAKLHP
jgi:hypoxanthine phosphoribosyltransferase